VVVLFYQVCDFLFLGQNVEDLVLSLEQSCSEIQATKLEFGTAIARADGLRSDWEYRYQVLRRKRVVLASMGAFHTMPVPGSMADVLFVSLSCSHGKDKGAWPLLDRYIKSAKPRFVIMMGDQVYLDDNDEIASAVWSKHLSTSSLVRRQAIVAKYQEHWSREPIRSIMANTPTYIYTCSPVYSIFLPSIEV
jgi:phosphodiesterase/alkaline phosphatase D-like protein